MNEYHQTMPAMLAAQIAWDKKTGWKFRHSAETVHLDIVRGCPRLDHVKLVSKGRRLGLLSMPYGEVNEAAVEAWATAHGYGVEFFDTAWWPTDNGSFVITGVKDPTAPGKGFYNWLMKAELLHDPRIGDLQGDARNDYRFPRAPRSWRTIQGYLEGRGACHGAVDAACEAWKVYRNCDNCPGWTNRYD